MKTYLSYCLTTELTPCFKLFTIRALQLILKLVQSGKTSLVKMLLDRSKADGKPPFLDINILGSALAGGSQTSCFLGRGI